MKILLVANYKTDGQQSMQRFAEALHAGLTAAGHEVEIERPTPFFGRLKPAPTGLGKWLGYLDKFLLFPPRLRAAARWADVVHIVDHSNAMYRPHVADRPHLITCHDLLAIRSARAEFSENRTGFTGRLLQRWILAHLQKARCLACVSQATLRDTLRLTGLPEGRVKSIPMGLNHSYAPNEEVTTASAARRGGIPFDPEVSVRNHLPPGPYLLHVGGGQWYKNRRGVVAIHAALVNRAPKTAPYLVIVGPPDPWGGEYVEYRQGVSHEDLAALYSGAEALLFPSLEEGFGWPIAEAQACGCPVVTTNKAPMTEVGGPPARYLNDPKNAEAGADAIAELLQSDAETRRKLVEAGLVNAARFSTEQMIRGYLSVYEELIHR